jgi:hypothetical protein
MDTETKQLLLLTLKQLERLDSELHGLALTLEHTSARALAIEGVLNELLPGFTEKFGNRYGGILALSTPLASDSLHQEIQTAIEKLAEN